MQAAAGPALFVAPLLRDLVGDAACEALFSARAEIDAILAFETALADAEAAEGMISADAARAIGRACATFAPDEAALVAGVARDGVVVPELVRQLRRAAGDAHGQQVHFGATSQDAIDTALVLRLRSLCDLVEARLEAVIAALDALAARDGSRTLMGHTRMQRARPITAAEKIEGWRAPLQRLRADSARQRETTLVLQLGGAVGNRAEWGYKAQAIADRMAAALGLRSAGAAWHAQRDRIVGFGQWLALIAGACGKIGGDVALMTQNEMAQATLGGGGGSSAMPEKSNPVKAEVLVSLARYAATQAGGLHHAMVHENERSGAAWTLEWMCLPPLAIAAGASLRQTRALIGDLSFSESVIPTA